MANHLDMGFTSWTWHKHRNSAHSRVNYDIIIPRKYFLIIDSFHWTVGTAFNGFGRECQWENTQHFYGHWQLPESINKVFTTEKKTKKFLMNGEKQCSESALAHEWMVSVILLSQSLNWDDSSMNSLLSPYKSIVAFSFVRFQVDTNYSLYYLIYYIFSVSNLKMGLNINIGENYA